MESRPKYRNKSPAAAPFDMLTPSQCLKLECCTRTFDSNADIFHWNLNLKGTNIITNWFRLFLPVFRGDRWNLSFGSTSLQAGTNILKAKIEVLRRKFHNQAMTKMINKYKKAFTKVLGLFSIFLGLFPRTIWKTLNARNDGKVPIRSVSVVSRARENRLYVDLNFESRAAPKFKSTYRL